MKMKGAFKSASHSSERLFLLKCLPRSRIAVGEELAATQSEARQPRGCSILGPEIKSSLLSSFWLDSLRLFRGDVDCHPRLVLLLPIADPQSSPRLPPDAAPGSGLASDARRPSQRRNANTVITPENGAFRKLPWATGFLSDAARANDNDDDGDPASSGNKASVANRGRPVCFSLPKRSCVLLRQAAAIFIQAGRSSRDGETTNRDEKRISSTARIHARVRELDDKMKGILSLCNHRRGTAAQVQAGGGTGNQDGSGSRLGAKVSGGCGNEDVRVIDGAQSSTGDQIKAGGMTRAQDSSQSLTVWSTGGSGTEDGAGSRTDAPKDGGCGPGARSRAFSCGQTATETEVTQGSDGSRTGVQPVGPSATGPPISRGAPTGARLTGAQDLGGGTGTVPFSGLGARVIQESGGGIRTGARGTWQSGAEVDIMLRCATPDQDGARVAVGSATGDEGSHQKETGTQKGGGRRTGTGAENGTEALRSGTGTQPTHGGGTAAGHGVATGDPPPPPLPLKSQSPGGFETSDKTDFSTPAELQKAKPKNQAQDLSPKQTLTSPPGRPSEPFCPVLSRDGGRVLLWPSEMVRHTRTSPSLSYSVNPLLYDFRAHARGRREAVGGIKSALIKRAACQRKRRSGGGGGGEVKSDESRDENRGGQAGNALRAAGRGRAGKAGAAFPHAHASKSTRVGLRKRRRRRRKKRGGGRKRGRRKSGEETTGKGQRSGGIITGLGKMARTERDDVGADERREKRRLSQLAARRLLEGPEKRQRPEQEEEQEEEWIVRNNDALLCYLPAKRCNRSKRVNAGAGPQSSSSGWGPALTKLLCGGAACDAAISPAPRTPRCPEITARPAGTETGRKHRDGCGRGPEDDGRGRPREIKAQEASACEAAISVVSPPRRDAAGRRQIRLESEAAISNPVPLSFAARRQTAAAKPPIGSCDAQKTESRDLSQEVTGGHKRKWTERPQTGAGKKRNAGPRRSSLSRTLDSTETSEGSGEETHPSHFSPDGTDSARRDNAPEDGAVVDTPAEDGARDDRGSEGTSPSHFGPVGTIKVCQDANRGAAHSVEDIIKHGHGSEATGPSHSSPDRTIERSDAHEASPPSRLTERFSPVGVAPPGGHRCHRHIQRVDPPHAELIDAPPADAPVSDAPEPPPSDGVQRHGKDKMSAACSANEEHASAKRQRGRSAAEPASPGKRPRFPLGLPPGCLPLGAPLLLPPPSSFSFRRTIIQHHLSVVAPPLPLPSYRHLLPAFAAPHPVALNPAPPSFLASPAIHVLDAPFPLATEFHPMLSRHHAALLAPPHPPALPLQVLF